jgi:hypothetical protein
LYTLHCVCQDPMAWWDKWKRDYSSHADWGIHLCPVRDLKQKKLHTISIIAPRQTFGKARQRNDSPGEWVRSNSQGEPANW